MFNSIPIVLVGNLVDVPELRFTATGVAVCKFTVASTPRIRKGEEWVDGEPTFMTCTAWRQLAENVAQTFDKGTRAIVAGRLRTERWDDKDGGGKRSRVVLDVDGVGPELTYAVAAVKRVVRGQGDPEDPWATASRSRPEQAPVLTEDEPAF